MFENFKISVWVHVERFFERFIQRYEEEVQLRKALHEALVEIRGNIRVFCRVRPMLASEMTQRRLITHDKLSDAIMVNLEHGTKKFLFDRIFDHERSQSDVFSEVSPLIHSCLDGKNLTIFAYGHTGSGKTYSMEGPEDNPGLGRRALMEIFDQLEQRRLQIDSDVYISLFEIYNEKIRDLLEPQSSNIALKMGEDGSQSIKGLTQRRVENEAKISEILNQGKQNRSVASTALNDNSSRSHAIAQIVLKMKDLTSGNVSIAIIESREMSYGLTKKSMNETITRQFEPNIILPDSDLITCECPSLAGTIKIQQHEGFLHKIKTVITGDDNPAKKAEKYAKKAAKYTKKAEKYAKKASKEVAREQDLATHADYYTVHSSYKTNKYANKGKKFDDMNEIYEHAKRRLSWETILDKSSESPSSKTLKIERILKCHPSERLRNLAWESGNETKEAEELLSSITEDDKRLGFSKILADKLRQIQGYMKLGAEVEKLRLEFYSHENLEHEKKLLNLWKLMMPDEELKSRKSNQWQEIGFQGDDPATDFRGMGLLGLDQLLFIAKYDADNSKKILDISRHRTIGFPYAIVGITITSLSKDLLYGGLLKNHFYNSLMEKPSIDDFHDVYCRIFHLFAEFWEAEHPETIMEFNSVKARFVERLEEYLARPESNLFNVKLSDIV